MVLNELILKGAAHPINADYTTLCFTMKRSELQQQLVNEMINGMNHKTMMAILYDFINESYDKFSDEELIEEVNEYYPELLEETNTN